MNLIRSFLFENLSWKLLSLSLALLIYSGARLFIHQEIRPLGHPLAPIVTRDFRKLPIRFLSEHAVQTPIRIEPDSVLVQVSGDLSTLEHLTVEDTLVFVHLPPDASTNPATNRVEVRVPANVRVLSVVPEHVVLTPVPKP